MQNKTLAEVSNIVSECFNRLHSLDNLPVEGITLFDAWLLREKANGVNRALLKLAHNNEEIRNRVEERY